MKSLSISIAFILSILCCNAKKEIPSFIHVCKRSDPELASCIINSVEKLRPKLIEGIQDIPPIEPLHLPELTAAEGRGIKVIVRDIVVHGCSNFIIDKLIPDVTNSKFEFEITLPKLIIDGLYNVDGKILLIPIKGEGEFHSEVENSHGRVIVLAEIYEQDGEKLFRFKSIDIDTVVEKGFLNLNNLFGGEKVLGEIVNSAINLNFQHFFNEFKPIIEEVLSKYFLDSANQVVNGYSFDDILPQ